MKTKCGHHRKAMHGQSIQKADMSNIASIGLVHCTQNIEDDRSIIK